MKKFFILIFSLLISGNLLTQNITADQIIRKVNDVLNPQTVYSKIRLIIQTTSGKKRTFEYESWAKNQGEQMLLRYTYPRRVQGQAILMLHNADDIWMYFPRTNRVRKMATHAKKQKFEGSDFTYEDFGSGKAFIDDFDAILLGKEKRNDIMCYKMELKRKSNADISYSRLLMWVDKTRFIPIEIHYFDNKNPERLIKILYLNDIKEIQGIPTPMKMIMKNVVDASETIMETLEANYNMEIPDELFTEKALKRR